MDTLSHVCKWELWRVICGILKDINRYDKSSICIPGPRLLDGQNSITTDFFRIYRFRCCAISPMVKSKLLFLIRYQSVCGLAFAFLDFLRFERGRFLRMDFIALWKCWWSSRSVDLFFSRSEMNKMGIGIPGLLAKGVTRSRLILNVLYYFWWSYRKNNYYE